MAHRKWKEIKLQPSMSPGPAVPGSCLASFHFRWAIHPIRPVLHITGLPAYCDIDQCDKTLIVTVLPIPIPKWQFYTKKLTDNVTFVIKQSVIVTIFWWLISHIQCTTETDFFT